MLDPLVGRVLLVVAACAVVAVASGGSALVLAPAGLDGGWLRAVRMVGTVTLAAGIVGLLSQRMALREPDGRGPDPTAVGLRAAATTMVLLLAIGLLVRPALPPHEAGQGPPSSSLDETQLGGDGPGALPRIPSSIDGSSIMPGRRGPSSIGGITAPAGSAPVPDDELLRRLARYLPLLLLLLLGIAALLLHGRRPAPAEEDGPAPDAPVDAADAEAGLEASLDAVALDSGDPREQIVAAYRRLLATLARAGASRQPQEAPHEHLRRVLGPLGVRSGPLHRLASLYVLAAFSERDITTGHRAEAARALEDSLAGVRAAAIPVGSGAAAAGGAEAAS